MATKEEAQKVIDNLRELAGSEGEERRKELVEKASQNIKKERELTFEQLNRPIKGGMMGIYRDEIECPYCEEEQPIDHDDGAGYTEGKLETQQCPYCDHYFTYTTSIVYHYEANKADCLNGADHKWEPTWGSCYPSFTRWGEYECATCEMTWLKFSFLALHHHTHFCMTDF